MRHLGLCLLFFLSTHLHATTWYVRADGGSRYSAKAPKGQCDGKSDAPYPGRGVNRPCAFSDYRYLWDDQAYANIHWVIAGGDTVILDNAHPWRVGFDGDGHETDRWCFGANGPYDCTNPTIPAGTAAQHTRILGRNYAACDAPNKMTQIFGGHGVGAALNLKGAQYVDVQCLELTRHSQCMIHGSPVYPSGCKTSLPLDDYDADGIQTDVQTHDLLLEDVWIHGHTDRGILGPIGGLVTATRVTIAYNGLSGWDFDDGSGTASVHATLKMDHSTVEWNGCNQEYPAKHEYPAISCYSQSTGGYGDGIGTPANMGMDVFIDHSTFRYNTQDGEDFGHVDTGSHTLHITNSLSYANNGGQFKWGPNFTNVVFENNLVLGNCARMSAPIAGAPATYNQNLSDFCRAGSTLSFNFRQNGTALLANNTIVSYAPTTFDINCWDTSCSSSTLTLENNILRGYDNPATYKLGGEQGGPAGFYFDKPLGSFVRKSNVYYGLRNVRCLLSISVGEVCADPQFVAEPRFTTEQSLDNFNFHLAETSPARHSGIRVPGLNDDYDGKPRPPSGNFASGALQ
jgi:hypothetical protein